LLYNSYHDISRKTLKTQAEVRDGPPTRKGNNGPGHDPADDVGGSAC
jgi:hypothetical protein